MILEGSSLEQNDSQTNVLLDVDDEVKPVLNVDKSFETRQKLEIRAIEELQSQNSRGSTPEPEPAMTPKRALQVRNERQEKHSQE